jgi:hypothetical protein
MDKSERRVNGRAYHTGSSTLHRTRTRAHRTRAGYGSNPTRAHLRRAQWRKRDEALSRLARFVPSSHPSPRRRRPSEMRRALSFVRDETSIVVRRRRDETSIVSSRTTDPSVVLHLVVVVHAKRDESCCSSETRRASSSIGDTRRDD